MRYPRGINVKHIYLVFFSIVSIALFVFTMIIYGQYKKVQLLNSNTVRQYEAVRQSRTILMDLVDMESGVRGYVITGDARFLAPYAAANDRVRNEVIELRYATYWEDKSFAETNDWLDRLEAIQKRLAAQVEARRQVGSAAMPAAELEKQRAETAGLRQSLDQSIARRLNDLNAHSKDAEAQKSNFVYILIFGTVFGVGILLVGLVVILKLEAERERLQDETEKAEVRFRRVMHGINDGLYELNFVNESLYASKEFKAMLGYDDHELEDTVDMATGLIHPDDLAQALEVRRQYIMKQTPHYINIFRMKHKDGTWRWVMSRGVGTWDKFGQIRSIIGTHTDITEQKTREEEFKQLHADMEAFLYITSHDMRAPLVNLKGFSHELSLAVKEMSALMTSGKKLTTKDRQRIDAVLNADIPEALGFIGNAVDRMDTLTTAILDLSRIGKYVYRDELVDAQAIFDKCLGAQSYEIAEKNVEVVVEPLPTLVTDPVALEQILGNLLDNAVKFLKPDQPGRIEVACHETGRDYVFSIRDNGRGIDAADSARVFHIFRRARNTGNVRGLGIGMAFVKATLRKLGGAIWFDSTIDVGTTFYVSLPKKAAATGPTHRLEAERGPVLLGAANANSPRAMAG